MRYHYLGESSLIAALAGDENEGKAGQTLALQGIAGARQARFAWVAGAGSVADQLKKAPLITALSPLVLVLMTFILTWPEMVHL